MYSMHNAVEFVGYPLARVRAREDQRRGARTSRLMPPPPPPLKPPPPPPPLKPPPPPPPPRTSQQAHRPPWWCPAPSAGFRTARAQRFNTSAALAGSAVTHLLEWSVESTLQTRIADSRNQSSTTRLRQAYRILPRRVEGLHLRSAEAVDAQRHVAR